MWSIRMKVNTLESRERLRGLVRSCRNVKLYLTYLYELEARTIFVRDSKHPFGIHVKQPDHWMIVSDHQLSHEENSFVYKVHQEIQMDEKLKELALQVEKEYQAGNKLGYIHTGFLVAVGYLFKEIMGRRIIRDPKQGDVVQRVIDIVDSSKTIEEQDERMKDFLAGK